MTPLPPSSHAKPVDSFLQATELEKELKRAVRGEVRFDRGSRALYATDGSNYRQIPIGLVIPRDAEDVVAAVAACRKYGAPVLPGRAMLQRRGCPGFHEVHESGDRDRSPADVCPGAARDRAGHTPESDTETSADVCARPLHTQPLHDRRDDWKQFMRHALIARWQDRR